MNKKENLNSNSKLIIVIAVMAFTVIVGGATYAFFATTRDINASTPVNTQTAASMYSFTATANETIEFNISAVEMSEASASERVLKNDSANIYMEVASATDNETTTCTYDIQWVWDSDDMYTEADVDKLPYSKDGKTYPYELSITIDGKNETDLSKLTWTDGKAIVVSGLEIKSTSKAPTKVTHFIEVNSYNIPVHQANLYNKNFRAHLEVVNNSCASVNGINEVASKFFIDKLDTSIDMTDTDGEVYSGKVVSENGIRFEGGNPNNYVRFDGELWRVIGVFDETSHGQSGEQLVKLIKALPLEHPILGDNKGTNGLNNWSTSLLKGTLNDNYYNNKPIEACLLEPGLTCSDEEKTTINNQGLISQNARDMIQPVTWYLGGVEENNITANEIYNFERDISHVYGENDGKLENTPIGLMYVSDYGYAVLSEDCSRDTVLADYYTNNATCYMKNWMYIENINQWTITHSLGRENWSFSISKWGNPRPYGVSLSNSVSPVIYLKSETKITGGKGTKSEPYTISYNDKVAEFDIIGDVIALNNGDFYSGLTKNADKVIDFVDRDKLRYSGKINLEKGLRYAGRNPNNFVWFNDELWRIIGVFGEETHGRSGEQLVKLIKAKQLPDYYQWDSNKLNNWSTASLKETLNNNYFNNTNLDACSEISQNGCNATTVTNVGIKDGYRGMIQPVTWFLGGTDSERENTIEQSYNYERDVSKVYGDNPGKVENLPVGLMYPSDFGYATFESECPRNTELFLDFNNCYRNDWLYYIDDYYMYDAASFWSITPSSGYNTNALYLTRQGIEGIYKQSVYYSKAISPVVYLKQSVKITGGIGTKSSPYTLSI